MSKKISTTMGGFTPLFDNVIQDVGIVGAGVFGRMWRYCQGARGVCQASTMTIATELNMSTRTVIRWQQELCKAGYLEDLTPDLRNKPHTYRDAKKVELIFAMNAVTESHSDRESQQDGMTLSHSAMTESHSGYDLKSHEETLEETHEETNTNGSDEPSPKNGDTPINFQQWHTSIKDAKNRPAALRKMCETLYPGLDPPAYGYLGKVAKKVGGAGRLADLLWQHSSRPPTGDLLSYIQKIAKGNGNNGRYASKKEPETVSLATGFKDFPDH